eukprot:9565082-Alexandrium_andersonii.AAC.1
MGDPRGPRSPFGKRCSALAAALAPACVLPWPRQRTPLDSAPDPPPSLPCLRRSGLCTHVHAPEAD